MKKEKENTDLIDVTKISLDSKHMEFLMNYGKRSNVLFNVEVPMIIYFSYRFVKIDLPDLFSKGDIPEILKAVCKQMGIVYADRVTKYEYSFLLWLSDEVKAIQILEEAHLKSDPDPDMIAAGSHELNELGEINMIDSLAGGDILKWAEVEKLPYHQVFDKLKKNIVESKVSKQYNKIIESKIKGRK